MVSKFSAPFLLLFLCSLTNASVYSEKIKKISTEKISQLFPHHEAGVICLSTAENPFLVGLVHQVPIHVAVDQVIRVFEDFNAYPQIFKDLKRVNLLEKNWSSEFLVEYESIIPIPFVPNSIYQLQYSAKTIEKPSYERSYVFTLKKSGSDLKSLDGMAILKKISLTETLYQEADFIEADLGMIKSFASKSIWTDTVTGSFESDFGLKFKTENPKMESKEILKQSRFSVERATIQNCIDHKKDAGELFAK